MRGHDLADQLLDVETLLPEIVGAAGDNLRDISVSETTLESVFIKLTGRDLRD